MKGVHTTAGNTRQYTRKKSLKEAHFQSNEDIHKKVVKFLKTISQNDFRRCLEAWNTPMGRCVFSDGNYFERDKV
jgi:hypothetical protein